VNQNIQMSVVIASIGRQGLTQILVDIRESCVDLPLNIVLVLDGVGEENPNLELWKKLCWKVIINPIQLGPSVSYTIGMREVITPFFRIFTDDDEWDKEAFKGAIRSLSHGAVLVCQTNAQDELGLTTRNSFFPQELSPLESVYAPILPWRRNGVYFHLTSMIFPIEAASLEFDETLVIREDLEWLQRIFDSGIKFVFSETILGTVYPSHVRSTLRQSLSIDIDWVKRLSLISPKLARQFVFFHCFRSTAVSGKPSRIVKQLIPLCKIVGVPNIGEFASIVFYLTLSLGKKFHLH
jgi:hypothetical protein